MKARKGAKIMLFDVSYIGQLQYSQNGKTTTEEFSSKDPQGLLSMVGAKLPEKFAKISFSVQPVLDGEVQSGRIITWTWKEIQDRVQRRQQKLEDEIRGMPDSIQKSIQDATGSSVKVSIDIDGDVVVTPRGFLRGSFEDLLEQVTPDLPDMDDLRDNLRDMLRHLRR